jgi:OPA family glycerol-3-phosphate transporter-like MFS transporter
MSLTHNKPYTTICILAWLVYVTAYLGRINLSIAIPLLEEQYGYSKAALGLLASGFFAAYAGGQVINGVLGDRLNPRYFVALGLLAAGLSNIVLGLVPTLPVMFVSWVVNGYFQSMLWGPLLRTIAEYAPVNKHHGAVLLMSTTPSAGYFLSYTVMGKIAVLTAWENAFFVPGIALVLAAALWFWRLRGCRAPARAAALKEATQTGRPAKTGALLHFIVSSGLLYIIILGVLAGAVKEGLTLWGPALLAEKGGTGMERALGFMALLPLFNLPFIGINGLIAKSRAGPRRAVAAFTLLAVAAALLLELLGGYSFHALLVMFYLVMVALSAVNTLMTGYLPLEYRKDGRVSSAAGIIDSAFYLGAAVAGPAAGAAVEKFGWAGIFAGITVVSCAAFIASLLMVRTGKRI